jgi:RNA polymerase sigma factor (sigma-70 family)
MNVVNLSGPPPAEAEFRAFYLEHYRSVHGFIRAVYRSVDADDITSKVFTIAWQRFGHISPLCPKAWLIGVARNSVRNEHRGRRRAEMLIDRAIMDRPTTWSDQGDEAVPWETRSELIDAVNQLREADREIVLLSAWGGLDADELAVTLGITKNAATVRLHRARHRLRDVMGFELEGVAS